MPRGGIEDEAVIAYRIAAADVEKQKTHGEILKDGLLGPDDKRTYRGKYTEGQKARPKLKVDPNKGQSEERQGRPRTGRTNW